MVICVKSYNMKLKNLVAGLLFSFLFVQCYAQNKPTWSNDITINPVAGNYCRSEKVSTAFDGTIYVYRTVAPTPGGVTNKWEILSSTDMGQTWDTFVYAAPLPGNYRLTAFDIVAAGNDSTTFKLFTARSYVDTSGGTDTVSLAIDTFNLNSNTGYAMYLEKHAVYDPYHRGYTSLSLATDTRDKSSGAAPYTLSVVAAKAGPSDSIIVFTDNDGGMALNRISLYGTLNEIRHVSASIGSATSSSYGRLGIAWDEYRYHGDTFGAVKAAFMYPDDGTLPLNWGPITIGLNDSSYRNPSITLSQAAGNIGPGIYDIRAIVSYEYKAAAGDIDVMGRVADSVINHAPTFNNGFTISDAPGKQMYPYGVYDPLADKFLFTFYNAVDNSLPYVAKTVTSTQTTAPTIEMANYRNATSAINTAVWPRMDVNMAQTGKPAFLWNDNHISMYDAEFMPTRITGVVAAKDVQLYPNPANEQIWLSFAAAGQTKLNGKVLDMMGKEVYSFNLMAIQGANNIPVNVSTLPSGNYFLQIWGSSTAFNARFAIVK